MTGGHRRARARARARALALALALTTLTLLSALPPLAPAATSGTAASPICAPHISGPARQLAVGGGWTVVFVPRPWPLVVGQHVALDIVVCAAADGRPPPAALLVDADMPAHRHGMNYRPTVSALGGGRFRAEGLMFHMAGRWRVMFRLDGGEPVSQTLDVR